MIPSVFLIGNTKTEELRSFLKDFWHAMVVSDTNYLIPRGEVLTNFC